MNKSELIITDNAYNDMDLISDYIARDNAKAAHKLINILHRACYLLAEFPESGFKRPDFSHKNVSFYIVKKKYLIIYRVQDNVVYMNVRKN